MGGNFELFVSLWVIFRYDDVIDDFVENKFELFMGKVFLSNCCGFGLSY